YLLAAECAYKRNDLPLVFNIGPEEHEARMVRWLADAMAARWGEGASWRAVDGEQPHESATLALDSSRARQFLHWKPLLDADAAVAWTVDWYKNTQVITDKQIEQFMEM